MLTLFIFGISFIEERENVMTKTEKIAYLWNKKLEDAMSCGHPRPFEYADNHPEVKRLAVSLTYKELKDEVVK